VEADYVIVGAGAAGSVLAYRLAEHGTVALVEAGGWIRSPVGRIPKAFYLLLQDARRTYRYPTSDGEGWIRGRAVGGSTAINGLLYLRGEADVFDDLARRTGEQAWAWPQMRQVFDRMETTPLPDGAGLSIATTPAGGAVIADVLRAASELQVPTVADLNHADGPRAGYAPGTIRAGKRRSAADAFLAPRRRTIRLLTHTRAQRVILEGTRAVAVEALRRGRGLTIRARREVIVAGGAIESPLLLERSGIGAGPVLHAAGIRQLLDSPRVGEGLIEQRAITLKARLAPGRGLGPHLDTWAKRLRAGAYHVLSGRGPLAAPAFEALALIAAGIPREGAGAKAVDAQVLFTPLLTDDTGLRVAREPGIIVQGFALHPTSRGQVHITGPRAGDPPRITPRFLSTDYDRAMASRILHWQRELLAQQPLSDQVREELSPGVALREDGAIADFVRASGAGIAHAVGSCAMGAEAEAVLDPQLRVRGLRGLRVIDASVFPSPPNGATAAPTMALAWRGADLIAGDGEE